ncbi:MAG TPA: hypothetical protein PKN12_08100 [Bacteroidales bacterium]|nr:hypothetical protein [Bacteroidales bacterium]HPT09751.1 hypothetical protein [Bacteroidales bacterium]
MKFATRFSFLAILVALFLISCTREDKALKEDASKIADAMCKSMETMKKLRSAAPEDSLLMEQYRKEVHNNQIEMTILYDEFKKKYGEKAKTEKFNKEFSHYLKQALLNCKSLSREDRAQFEKELKEE